MSGARPEQFAPIAVVTRSGVDESIHFGAAVCIGADGAIEHAVGDPSVWIYPRSATKPLQALAMVRSGLDLDPEKLALVCSSHNGESIHQQTALAILAGCGLDDTALKNTADHPMHPPSAREAIRAGVRPSALQMGCSGKHSGMVATCVTNGWSVADYLDPTHPLQTAITATVTDLCGEPLAIGIDGCGAPAHVVRLESLARAARAIATGAAGESGDRIFEAMSGHPHMVGGTDRDVTRIVSAVPGFFAKDGAEAVYVGASRDGRAVALKISNGGDRARCTVFLAALARLGFDVGSLADELAERTFGHGAPVGSVRALGFG